MYDGIIIVEPITMTDSMLLSTDVPETDYAVYSSVTTYADGDRVRIAATHKVYESLVNSNVGNDPATNPLKWIEVGYVNRWKMFDGIVGTTTTKSGGFYYRFLPGVAVTSMDLISLSDCYTVRVRQIDPVYGTVYDQIFDVGPQPRSPDPWEFFFGVWTTGHTKLHIPDLQTYPNAELWLDVTGGPNAAIGAAVFGQGVTYGLGAQYGLKLGIKDYSVKKKDDWGNLTLAEGAYSDTVSFTMTISNGELDAFYEYLKTLRAKRCVYIVCGAYDSTILYGFFNNFEVIIPYFSHSDVQLELESLT